MCGLILIPQILQNFSQNAGWSTISSSTIAKGTTNIKAITATLNPNGRLPKKYKVNKLSAKLENTPKIINSKTLNFVFNFI